MNLLHAVAGLSRRGFNLTSTRKRAGSSPAATGLAMMPLCALKDNTQKVRSLLPSSNLVAKSGDRRCSEGCAQASLVQIQPPPFTLWQRTVRFCRCMLQNTAIA